MTIGSLKAQDFSQLLMDQYQQYKEHNLTHRRFKHSDLKPLLQKLPHPGFTVKELGTSYQGRSIHLVSVGTGPVSVLLWSQMHGNEATATMALFDIFNFLEQQESEMVQQLLAQLTLHFIPMLNPDGAELFQRRTLQGIDMNRDAVSLTCPESRILKSVRDQLQADWGFNLHDQNIYYNVGNSAKPATISFLAPAYDLSKQVNTQREDAMRVIAAMNASLQPIIPGQVGRYDDSFEPRAFGDNMQKWGTRTILVESGGMSGDPEKQQIRKLNFVALLTALKAIGDHSFQKAALQEYWDIPMNSSNLNDVIIRDVTVNRPKEPSYQVDLAIRRTELDQSGEPPLYYQGKIEDLGDLSTQFGYRELIPDTLEYAPGKVYPEVFADLSSIDLKMAGELLKKGYTYIKIEQQQGQQPVRSALPGQSGGQASGQQQQHTAGTMPKQESGQLPMPGNYQLPLDVVPKDFEPPLWPETEQPATFLLMKNGSLKYAVVNGFVIAPAEVDKFSSNGWIYR